ncbi:MFS transporter [Alkalihalophilus lindianensis]|uniref:MFS transporter n=1 Tax=Alkalihalophilus lindianensis TaxID=1630542 RepID=A0ABU3XG04_9BACI|nr:MFS transporter [Alkalihalophilus lindianensis]MDV2686821.1 MFS transporter [Alkalihalophilus lindianensis]
MNVKLILESWKYPSILLLGIGVSNLGAWVYLIALNLIVFDITGSPLAVAALYILIPLATLVTNFWSGSMIDRLNTRSMMIVLDLFRALCIFSLPWLLDLSIWFMYIMVLIINMATSMFGPASMVYITKLIPYEQRKKFNSLRSLIDSGAFLLGPALAGVLFIMGTPLLAIIMNAIALFLSGLITFFMPNVDKSSQASNKGEKLSLPLLKEDFQVVMHFSKKNVYITLIYFLFSSVMVMTAAVDSMEAAFAKEVLYLSDSDYGFLVSIAGAGIVVGAVINTVFVKKIATSFLIGLGATFVSIGYIIYAFSNSFIMAAAGFFILAFFLAFANTGFLTFYQNNIPVDVMGRIGSLYGLIEAALIILTTGIMGILAQLISIQFAIITGAVIMLSFSVTLCAFNLQPSKSAYYQPTTLEKIELN